MSLCWYIPLISKITARRSESGVNCNKGIKDQFSGIDLQEANYALRIWLIDFRDTFYSFMLSNDNVKPIWYEYLWPTNI